MDDEALQNLWCEKYKNVSIQIRKTAEIKLVATGFNTNIDAVVKINGEKISELAKQFSLSLADVKNCQTVLDSPKAVVCGMIKCFINGIAEEWLTDDQLVDKWIEQTIGADKLQMGGQAGIIANVLALTDMQKIAVNTASHPKILSDLFIKSEKLQATDENGKLAPACKINRAQDIPPVHRIMEFDKGDVLVLEGREYICPKSNRFIATYDPLNAKMQINEGFKTYLLNNGFDYFIIAGYNLLSGGDGLMAAQKSAELLHELKKKNGIMHLEIASTQDKKIRAYMMEKIAPLCDSIGLNEREALDVLEVISPDVWKKIKDEPLNAENLFEAILKIKQQIKVKRIQLHFFGLYICVQDKDYKFSAAQSLNGMLCAAAVAASKASLGYLQNKQDLLASLEKNRAKICFSEIIKLSKHINSNALLSGGIAEYEGYDIIAVPTLLVENPKTLVGMGDTISSLSLVCAR